MIIRLPTEFNYSTSKEDYAFVENGKLYIVGTPNYEGMMYDLTYKLRGYSRCVYCGNVIPRFSDCTLDHVHSRYLGGVSFPNNLLPSCKKCNGEKGYLTPHQYKAIRKISSQKEKAKRIKIYERQNEKARKKGKMFLPKSWLTDYDCTDFEKYIDFDKSSNSTSVKRHEAYFKSHGAFMHPIVVSSDGWVLDGINILRVAKKYNITVLPAIVFDNVIVIRK